MTPASSSKSQPRLFDQSDNINSISNHNNNKKQINSKLVASQITNDIIKPKAISASEAKFRNNLNNPKNYDSIGSSGGGYKKRAYQNMIETTPSTSDYSISIIRDSGASGALTTTSRSIDYLSCTSANSSDSSTNSNNCEYLHNDRPSSSQRKAIVNDYITSDYAMHQQQQRPKSSQSQHNPYKSPSEKKQYHRKHYSPQHTLATTANYTKKQHQHSTKKSQHHQHTHKHQSQSQPHTRNNNINNNISHISTDNSPPPKPRSLEKHSTTVKQRHS